MAFFEYDTVDLFAGPGGWDHAARALDLHVVGIEWDAAACATRRAADLATLGPDEAGDVRTYSAADFPNARGLIASPPCQTFSMAGKGAGRKALDDVYAGIESLAVVRRVTGDFTDERTALVLEPLRWTLAALDLGRPFEWIALEQVPTVLPVWERYASLLRHFGYSVATGNLHAEQYGVPQTRKRAVLVARLEGEAKLPSPTHSKYYTRTPDKLDDGVEKWVSMAEALGWGMTRRPYPAVAAGTGGGGADNQMIGGSGARRTIATEHEAGRWIEKARPTGPEEWSAPFDSPERWQFAGAGCGPAGMARNSGPGATRDPRPIDAPAYTIRANGSGSHPSGTEWVFDAEWQRSNYNAGPTGDGPREHWTPRERNDSRRVSVAEAAVLQSFPHDYPWRGGKSKQYQQVGNAIPPLLALAVLQAVTH